MGNFMVQVGLGQSIATAHGRHEGIRGHPIFGPPPCAVEPNLHFANLIQVP